MRIINVISRTDAYILIRDLNLKPKAAGTIDVDTLILSELKSLRNLSMANDIIISEIDFDYVIDKIDTLSGGGTASYPELPVATKNSLGGVVVSDYLKIDTSGQLSVDFETIIEATVESATSGLEQTLGAQYTQIIPNGNSVIIDGTPKFGHSISVKLIEGTSSVLKFPETNEGYTLDVYIGTTSAKRNIYAPSNDVTLVAQFKIDVLAYSEPKFYVNVFSNTEAALLYNAENIFQYFNFTNDTSWLNIIAVVNDGIDQDKVQELTLDGLDSFPIRINTSSQANFPTELVEALQETEATFNTQLNTVSIQASETQTLAQTNELKIGTKADQADLDITDQQVEQNRLAILTKADISALAQLALLVDTKADQAYVNQQIAELVGSAPEALNTVYELAAAIQAEQGIVDALNQSVANRVRFDIAEQALTEIQKENARTNIDAEKLGTAVQLVSQITAASLGAATAAQGAKADTALQSADVAPVALSGLFTSLASQSKIFDVVHSAYTIGSNTEITATDTLGQMLEKLQAQISNSSNGSSGFTWVNADQISGLTLTAPVEHKSLKFAKKDGILWICGSLRVGGVTNTTTKFFNISNAAYMVEQHVTNIFGTESQVAVCNANLYRANINSPPTNGNSLAMFYVLGTNLYLKLPTTFSDMMGGFIAFNPTPIGRLLN